MYRARECAILPGFTITEFLVMYHNATIFCVYFTFANFVTAYSIANTIVKHIGLWECLLVGVVNEQLHHCWCEPERAAVMNVSAALWEQRWS